MIKRRKSRGVDPRLLPLVKVFLGFYEGIGFFVELILSQELSQNCHTINTHPKIAKLNATAVSEHLDQRVVSVLLQPLLEGFIHPVDILQARFFIHHIGKCHAGQATDQHIEM